MKKVTIIAALALTFAACQKEKITYTFGKATPVTVPLVKGGTGVSLTLIK